MCFKPGDQSPVPRSHFVRAFAQAPRDGSGQLQDREGPSCRGDVVPALARSARLRRIFGPAGSGRRHPPGGSSTAPAAQAAPGPRRVVCACCGSGGGSPPFLQIAASARWWDMYLAGPPVTLQRARFASHTNASRPVITHPSRPGFAQITRQEGASPVTTPWATSLAGRRQLSPRTPDGSLGGAQTGRRRQCHRTKGADLGHPRHRPDQAYHAVRGVRQFGTGADGGLTGCHGEQVGAELVDFGQ
jgi:hypothetical protein